MRHELLTALIKSLPKAIRRNFVPAPDVARMALESLEVDYSPATDELLPSFALVLRRLPGGVGGAGGVGWSGRGGVGSHSQPSMTAALPTAKTTPPASAIPWFWEPGLPMSR